MLRRCASSTPLVCYAHPHAPDTQKERETGESMTLGRFIYGSSLFISKRQKLEEIIASVSRAKDGVSAFTWQGKAMMSRKEVDSQ